MTTQDPCNAIGTLFLEHYGRNMAALSRHAAKEAEKLGVPFKGELDAIPDRAKMLVFGYGLPERARLGAAIDAIGTLTGLYSVPSQMVVGLEGEHSDVLVRLVDVMQYRLDKVLSYIAERKAQLEA